MYTRLVKSVVVVLLLTLFACSEKESPIDLNKSDIVGEWETEYFECAPMYGPLKAVFTDEGTFRFEYYMSFNEDDDRSLVRETGMYSVSGNKLKYQSEYGYSGEVSIEAFTGRTAIFNVSNGEIGFSAKASKK
jgi:hypothetical protein|nr:MAG TPA: hypothetical protein [Caudoviricetes sp.]